MYRAKTRKNSNRNRILECIFRNPGISRTLIAEYTEITPATTTTTVTTLIEEGLVVELGEETPADSTGGRRRISLDICADFAHVIGVEFNQKALCTCLTDLKGTLLAERSLPHSEALGEQITDAVIEEIQALLAQVGDCSPLGIGIAVPGHMDRITQSHLISNHTIWHNFDADKIRKTFDIPVVLENNVRCMALAQYLFHPKASPNHFSFFHVGLGMFCANIVDDQLFLGNAYVSGEIGHTIVVPDGQRCECGKHGCLQTIASERWLLKVAKQLYDCDNQSMLRHLVDSADKITLEQIATAYAMGDVALGKCVSQALKYLGIATSNIAILMNPDKIFLHGQMFDFSEIHAELMDIVTNQLMFLDKDYVNTVEILPYSPMDGAIGGAALLILQHLLEIRS